MSKLGEYLDKKMYCQKIQTAPDKPQTSMYGQLGIQQGGTLGPSTTGLGLKCRTYTFLQCFSPRFDKGRNVIDQNPKITSGDQFNPGGEREKMKKNQQ